MESNLILASQFEANRKHLKKVAYRMLGSLTEAEDAVQEAWLRLSRAETDEIHNLGGWLTTVVARVCLDLLRSRRARREDPIDPASPEPVTGTEEGGDPVHAIVLADSVSLALLVVLETLTPSERVAFVLHEVFDMPRRSQVNRQKRYESWPAGLGSAYAVRPDFPSRI